MFQKKKNRYLFDGQKSTFFPRGKTRVLLSPERRRSEGDMKRGFYREEKSDFDHQIQYFFLFLKHWFHVCEQRASREN